MADNNGQSNDQHNQGGLIAFMFSMVFVLCFFVYLLVIHPGVELPENIKAPASAEQKLADADVDVSGVKEPWVANADMVKHGKKVFQANCTMCHGPEGKGDGPAGASLNPKPRNLIEGPWKKGGGFIGIYTVLAEGLPGGGMASYKAQLKSVDRWALVQFINSVTNAKVKEDAAKVAEFAKTAQ